MKMVTRNAAALFGLSLAAVAASSSAEAGSRHHGYRAHHARHHGHHARRAGGNASWYASGQRTANGERFNPNGLTAAHRSLPFGTRVRVTNRTNGRSVVVRINDRGPFIAGRQIDLARGAARAIGMGGTSFVSMSVMR